MAETAVALTRLTFPAQVDLRVDPTDARVVGAVAAALGVELPAEPNTVERNERRAVLWLGPDEWLVVDEGGSAPEIEPSLRGALAGAAASIVDVSASRAVFELTGPRAREVLLKGCWLDLHPRSFGPGRCAQSVLARAQIVLWQVGDEPAYRILVPPSFAPYLGEWLTDAMAEYRERSSPGEETS